MDLPKKINKICQTDNTLNQDICRAFWFKGIITGISLSMMGIILLIIGVII